jgi:hypothetical protein
VGEQHAEGHVAAAGVRRTGGTGQEFGDEAGDGSVEFEEAAFVENHRHGRGGDDFSEGREIEESGGGYVEIKVPTSRKTGETWGTRIGIKIPTLSLQRTERQGWGTLGILFIRELAEGFQGYKFGGMGDGDGGGGERAVRDRLTQDGEGGGEEFVLIVEGREQRG